MQLPVMMSKNTLRVVKIGMGFHWTLEQKKSGATLIGRRVRLLNNGNSVIVTPETGLWTTCMSIFFSTLLLIVLHIIMT